jgi:hypothetical protein
MFTPAQLLGVWREQRPRSQVDLGSSVTGKFGKSLARGRPASDLSLYRRPWEAFQMLHSVYYTQPTFINLTTKCWNVI